MAAGNTYKRNTSSPEMTKQLAQTLTPYLRPGDIIVLAGDLGAGKTHFVQGVAQGLGVTGEVTSPTFPILMTYEGGSLPLFHFDLYRLETSDDLEDIGFFDILEAGGVSFIEWGDKFPDALPGEYLVITIEVNEDESRQVTAAAVGRRAHQLLVVWSHDTKSRLIKV